ncbi:MAG: FAD-dependent thymidylate synthase, partial [Dolichospermum sp.]|nr:FAD-dependent thymidylate synthase [Dolichospermum sp.]
MSNQSDPFFVVEVLRQTLDPQQLVYLAMHQDYSEAFVINELDKIPEESKCGEIIVNRLLAGERGHWGCLEHPQISFACGYFPHSVMQQARTHRVSVSFDVQSGRYTGQRILAIAKKFPNLTPFYSVESALIDNPGLVTEIEKLFYLRPVGFYTDRKGNKYDYNEHIRHKHTIQIAEAVLN